MFGRKKITPPPLIPKQTAIRDPFAVIPVQPDNVEMKRDSHGMMHLRLMEKPTGFTGRVVDWLHYDYSRRIELDEHGTLYYSCVDGKTTLNTITDKIASQCQISRQQAEEAVIVFTKKLMTLNMLALIVPEELMARRSHEQS